MTSLSTHLCMDAGKHKQKLLMLAQIIGGSLLIALCAQIRIPLPFTPVPITLQTLAVLLVGGMLGSRNGALSVLLYLAEGVLGLPVLSGGRADILALMSPVGGYLVGFVFMAYITGWFTERSSNASLLMLGMILGSLVMYAFGAAWLAQFIGLKKAIFLGIVPFLPGDFLKLVLAAMIFKRLRKN